jgi:PleD family two-component response regulator
MGTYERKTQDVFGQSNTLFAGDASLAGVDGEQLRKAGYRLCPGVGDAVALSSQERFTTIYVAVGRFDGGIESALRALRKGNGDCRIVLLVRMLDEPWARLMVRTLKDRSRPVDDYMICPVDTLTTGGETIIAAGVVSTGEAARSTPAANGRIRELERLATEDDLTGLRSRRYVREFLGQITALAAKDEFRVTLLVFDIDDFKRYNDQYGHAVGDNVLRQTAIMMQRCCRSHDVTGRIGGDEFAFIFWDCASARAKNSETKARTPGSERRSSEGDHPNEAIFMAERFRKEVSSAELSFLGSEGKGVLTISGGLASFPKDGHSVEQLFDKADIALLEAKRSGKNRIYLVGQ